MNQKYFMYNGVNNNANSNLLKLKLNLAYGSNNISSKNKINNDGSKVSNDADRKNSEIVDESSISNVAYNIFEKENDIKKFTSLFFSNENTLIENAKGLNFDSSNIDRVIDKIINNEKFNNDLFS